MKKLISELRNRKVVLLFRKKQFIRFRINPEENRIKWLWELSLDKKNWVIQHDFLSLKDVVQLFKTYNK